MTAEYTSVEQTAAATEEVDETVEAAAATEKATEESTVSKKFSIIVASTPNEQKAQLAIEELSAKHEAAYTVVQGDGRHRIAYGTYNSNKEAVDALSNVKGTFPDAWILSH